MNEKRNIQRSPKYESGRKVVIRDIRLIGDLTSYLLRGVSSNEASSRLLLKIINLGCPHSQPLELVLIHQWMNKLDSEPASSSDNHRIICMNAICPHSGGPLHLGEIEELVSEPTTLASKSAPENYIICPWHAYRFSCRTGNSIDCDDYSASVFPASLVSLGPDDRDGAFVRIEFPFEPKLISCTAFEHTNKKKSERNIEIEHEKEAKATISVLNGDEAAKPTSLIGWAIRILKTSDPTEKVRLTFEVADLWKSGTLPISDPTISLGSIPDAPSRDGTMNHIAPSRTKRLGKAGSVASRIAILHAIANIEQWAIDLAWDIMARFHLYQVQGISLPREFFSDFVKVAADEAKHYSFLVERIEALGSTFGSLPVHGGLWDSASATSHDLLCRLAIVHMVHEARGLDVNPQTIAKFERVGDDASADKLKIIHEDEITHVACGQKWFRWICETEVGGECEGEKVYTRFHDIVSELFRGPLKPPFNEEDRLKAGLDPQYYLPLSR